MPAGIEMTMNEGLLIRGLKTFLMFMMSFLWHLKKLMSLLNFVEDQISFSYM